MSRRTILLYLLIKDCKELFLSKKKIGVIGIVLIIIIISTYCNGVNKETKNQNSFIQFGVVDQDNSTYSKLLLDYFGKSESFSSYIKLIQGNRIEIEKAFQDGELDIYLEIPEKFAENMIYMEHMPVKVRISTADTTKAILIRNILESYEKYIRAVEINCVALYDAMTLAQMDSKLIEEKNVEISYDLIFTALGKEEFFQYKEIGNFPSTTIVNYYMCAILSILIIYSGLYVGFLLMKEKQLGTLRRLHTTGMPMTVVLLEKILLSSVLIFFVFFIVNFITVLTHSNQDYVKTGIFYFSAIFFCISFTVFLSGIFHKVQNYMIVCNFISFLFLILGGGLIPIMYLPTEIVTLSKFTPLYWFIRMLLMIQNGIEKELFIRLIIGLFMGTVLFYLLSCFAYRREKVRFEE